MRRIDLVPVEGIHIQPFWPIRGFRRQNAQGGGDFELFV